MMKFWCGCHAALSSFFVGVIAFMVLGGNKSGRLDFIVCTKTICAETASHARNSPAESTEIGAPLHRTLFSEGSDRK